MTEQKIELGDGWILEFYTTQMGLFSYITHIDKKQKYKTPPPSVYKKAKFITQSLKGTKQ